MQDRACLCKTHDTDACHLFSQAAGALFYRWHFGCRPPIHLITMHQCRQTNKNQCRNQSSDNRACDSNPVLDQRATESAIVHVLKKNSCNPSEKISFDRTWISVLVHAGLCGLALVWWWWTSRVWVFSPAKRSFLISIFVMFSSRINILETK